MPDLNHIHQIRQEMPAVTSRLYFNAGTFGPMPTCVVQAMQEYLRKEHLYGRLGANTWEEMSAIYTAARSAVARLLNAAVDEIALTDNTGEGLNAIIFGFDWHEGDEVITTNHEHISVLAPLYQIRDRYGVVIHKADLGPMADRPALKAITDLVTPRTRLIALSHVTWTTGAVVNISEVGYMGREFGIPVLVDGAQSAGMIPIDVKALGVDFYAIPMQKWLCGPDGTGALYVRRELLNTLKSTYVGYYSIKHEEGIEWELNEGAQRFELGGRQVAALTGQAAVLQWLEETVGREWLFARISALHTYAYHALQAIPGVTILTPVPGASGLISFTLAGLDDVEVVNHLREQHNIHIRNIPSTHSLRISTGFYNTEEEIDHVVHAIQSLMEERIDTGITAVVE